MDSTHYPVAVIALEMGITADVLAARLGDDVKANDIGLSVISREVARRVIDDHRAALQTRRDRDAAEREEAQRRPHPLRERIHAISAAQSATGQLLDGSIVGGQALAHIKEVNGDRERQLDAAARTHDELSDGRLEYHPIAEMDRSR